MLSRRRKSHLLRGGGGTWDVCLLEAYGFKRCKGMQCRLEASWGLRDYGFGL